MLGSRSESMQSSISACSTGQIANHLPHRGDDLGTAEGRAKMFKFAKQMRRDRTDVEGTNFIKGEDGVIQVDGG